jgi:hypothetical protein
VRKRPIRTIKPVLGWFKEDRVLHQKEDDVEAEKDNEVQSEVGHGGYGFRGSAA